MYKGRSSKTARKKRNVEKHPTKTIMFLFLFFLKNWTPKCYNGGVERYSAIKYNCRRTIICSLIKASSINVFKSR